MQLPESVEEFTHLMVAIIRDGTAEPYQAMSLGEREAIAQETLGFLDNPETMALLEPAYAQFRAAHSEPSAENAIEFLATYLEVIRETDRMPSTTLGQLSAMPTAQESLGALLPNQVSMPDIDRLTGPAGGRSD